MDRLNITFAIVSLLVDILRKLLYESKKGKTDETQTDEKIN